MATSGELVLKVVKYAETFIEPSSECSSNKFSWLFPSLSAFRHSVLLPRNATTTR